MKYSATYFDGKTTRPWDVRIDIGRRGITIYTKNKTHLASWPYRMLARVEPIGRKFPVHLRNRLDLNARLTVTDDKAIDAIRLKVPKLFYDRQSHRRLLRIAVVLGLITSVTVVTAYLSIPRMAKPIAQAFSIEMEERLGRNTLKTLDPSWRTCEGEGERDIEQVRALLTAQRDIPQTLRIMIMQSNVMNAFALPGGYIILTDELVRFMESPDEFAGVIAHEMGHVALRHPLEGMVSQAGVVLFLNMITAGNATDLLGLGATAAMIAYTRDYEAQADQYALDLMQDAGINPQAYANLFQRFDAKQAETSAGTDPIGIADILRTHPYSSERAAKANEVKIDKPITVLSEEAWQRIQSLCEPETTDRVDLPAATRTTED